MCPPPSDSGSSGSEKRSGSEKESLEGGHIVHPELSGAYVADVTGPAPAAA
jgi:hypothetical protein